MPLILLNFGLVERCARVLFLSSNASISQPSKNATVQPAAVPTSTQTEVSSQVLTPAKPSSLSLPVIIEETASVRQRRARPAARVAPRTDKSAEDKNEGDSLSTTERLAREEKRRDELAAEMVQLAGTLKSGARRTHAALVNERPMLDKLAMRTETNIERARRETLRIAAQLGRSWSFTLCLWALIGVTMMLFFWTIFLMKSFRK